MNSPSPIAESSQLANLTSTVLNGDFCIGCGACASVADSPFEMEFTAIGTYRPVLKADLMESALNARVEEACPFSRIAANETEIAADLYPDVPEDALIGRYIANYAGSVSEAEYRDMGSSGGMTTWLLAELLQQDLVDAVIHVVGADDPVLFRYGISDNTKEVREHAKSRYYPIEMSQVMDFVRHNPQRYVFVGVPCFVRAIRLLARQDEVIAQSVSFAVAIFCGHLKTSGFAEYLAWQMGVKPSDLTGFDFRVKNQNQPASRYSVKATSMAPTGPVSVELPVHALEGTNWGLGFFKPRACDYCDDIAGETADVTFGDAWLPAYVKDSRGTNIVVVRNMIIKQIIDEARDDGRLMLDDLRKDDVVKSQAGNFRHRREGLAYRVWKLRKASKWHPPKRVRPDWKHLSRNRRKIYDLRIELAARSISSFKQAKEMGDLDYFHLQLKELVTEYSNAYNPLWRRLAKKVRNRMYSLVGK